MWCIGSEGMKVLFSTKTWEGDWQKIVSGGFTRKVLAASYPFDSRLLVVNNTKQPRGIFEGFSDDVIFVEDLKDKTLAFFGLKEEDFKGGYYYSIAELAELQYAFGQDYDYLVHYASDTISTPGDWVSKGIEIRITKTRCSLTIVT